VSHAPHWSNARLVATLQQGGCVLVMRHASAPVSRPEPRAADADNTSYERQLDPPGKAHARAMGEAIRQLRIPVDEIFSSATFRARETVRFAGLAQPRSAPELDEFTTGADARSGWLRAKAVQPPQRGTNILVVTDMPHILGSLDDIVSAVAPGDVLVFRPDGTGAVKLVARIRIEQWSQLAVSERKPPPPLK
jgi:phosphohistidine phosphatase SixA